MDKLLIIADDLTGACDAAVQFAGVGITTLVIPDLYEIHNRNWECEILAINTSSRHDSPEEAKIKVIEAMKALKSRRFTHIYKKTDSVLRGNIGIELETVLVESGFKRLHFVPAHPAMGRFTRKGIQYIDKKQVHESDFGRDPLNPLQSSHVIEIIESQSKVKIDLAESIPKFDHYEGIVVHNASSISDLEDIANSLNLRGELRVCAGASGFASFLPERLNFNRQSGVKASKLPKSLLVVNGSMHPLALSQVKYGLDNGFEGIKLGPGDIKNIKIPQRESEGSVIYSMKDPEEFTSYPLTATQHTKIFSEIAMNVWNKDISSVLMVIGGDTLLEILRILKINRLRPCYEILPGVVLSEFEYQGKNRFLISKPGSFGKTDVLTELMSIIVK